MREISIYEAESVYDYPVNENQLTSRVFGMLAMLPHEIALFPFLKRLARGVTHSDEADPVLAEIGSWGPENVDSAQICLWPTIDKKRPDVLIETRDVLIMIEAKLGEEPQESQLEEQFKEARTKAENKRKKLAYFLLTRDDQAKEVAQKAEKELRKELGDASVRVHWRSWREVWKWLREIKDEAERKGIEGTSLRLLDATIKLLEARQMKIKGPTGFLEEWFDSKVIEALDKVQKLCAEIGTTMEEVIQKIEKAEDSYNLKSLNKIETWQPKKRNLRAICRELPDYVPRSFEFFFKDKRWGKIENPEQQPCLYIGFYLEAKRLGIYTGFWWPEAHKTRKDEGEEILEKARDLRKRGRGKELSYLGWDDDGNVVIETRLGDILVERGDRQVGEQTVERLIKGLVEVRDFVNELASQCSSLRRELGYRIPRTSG